MIKLAVTSLGLDTAPTTVWYAAYGSNLCADRFMCYVRGAAPTPNHVPHVGCRCADDPLGEAVSVCVHPVAYAGTGSSWGEGGVAFLDIDRRDSATLIRLWRVTTEQFNDIWAMENGREPGSIEVDWTALSSRGRWIGVPGAYGQVISLGMIDGSPIASFTWPAVRFDLCAPSEAYRDVIARGSAEISSR